MRFNRFRRWGFKIPSDTSFAFSRAWAAEVKGREGGELDHSRKSGKVCDGILQLFRLCGNLFLHRYGEESVARRRLEEDMGERAGHGGGGSIRYSKVVEVRILLGSRYSLE